MVDGKILKCTVWNDGGNGWGIRIGKERQNLYERTSSISIRLDEKIVKLPITETFWTTCPEIRSKDIREFYFQHGINKENKSNFWIILQELKNGVFNVTVKPK